MDNNAPFDPKTEYIPPFDPFGAPPPAPKPRRVWLWIVAVLGCLLCVMVLALSLPVGGILLLVTQTAYANHGQTVGARVDATMTGGPAATATAAEALSQPPAGWKQVLADSFDSNDAGWNTEADETDRVVRHPAVKNGQYIYLVDRLDIPQLWVERPRVLDDAQPNHFFLAVDVKPPDDLA